MVEVIVTLATAAAERFVVIADKVRKAIFSRVRERLGLLRSALPWRDRQGRGDTGSGQRETRSFAQSAQEIKTPFALRTTHVLAVGRRLFAEGR